MNLERAKLSALTILVAAGDRGTMATDVSSVTCLGIGYAVASGWATYRGGNIYIITPAGHTALKGLKQNI